MNKKKEKYVNDVPERPPARRILRALGDHVMTAANANADDPQHIPPDEANSMIGSGVRYKGKTFITHTTLNHQVSAIRTFTSLQKMLFAAVVSILILGFYLSPLNAGIILIAGLSMIYFIDAAFNLYLVMRSLKRPPEIAFT